MISICIRNSVNNDLFTFEIPNPKDGSTFVHPSVHSFISDFLRVHYDRDVRFYLDYHRNYVEEDIFKGF